MNDIKKKKRLKKLKKVLDEWSICKRCELCETREKFVFYRGNPCAKIFIVGEAPGREEDIKGVPFVGKSGKELDKLFVECGLDPKNDVFVTNILGCNPPNNAQPTSRQAKRCRVRLNSLLKIVKPKVVLTLGKQAALHLTGTNDIIQYSGYRVDRKNKALGKMIGFVLAYHPSYYLRSGFNKKIKKQMIMSINLAIEISKEK
jgi:uracil-DNA glycosylase family 4